MPLRFQILPALVLLTSLSGCRGTEEVRSASGAQEAGESRQAKSSLTETIPGTEISFEMALVPGGAFLMGSPDTEAGRDPDEGPQHLVSVGPFWMGVHEVTWNEFDVFRRRELDNDSTSVPNPTFQADAVARPSPPYEDPAHGMGTNGFPAVSITQWAALNYSRWLWEKTGRFYRLPTEAEWEYACRAGATGPYNFGDAPDSLDANAWHLGNSGEVFHKVGTRRPNRWGLFDMHGNVAEWTLDQYDRDAYASFDADTTASPWIRPTSLHPRTVRGGAYDDYPEDIRCAARLESSLNWKRRDPQIPKSFWWNTDSPFVGFRLVSPVQTPDPNEIEEFWKLVLGE